MSKSELLLIRLSATIKSRGLYNMFIGAAETELKENPRRDTWVDYNLAHCHFILGNIKRAFEIGEQMVFRVGESEPDKRVAVVRLYAELLAAVGRYDVALRKLREVLVAVDHKSLKTTTRAHAQSIEIMLLTDLGEYDEAFTLAEGLLADAATRNDKRGVGIARARLGFIESRRQNLGSAKKYLEQAAEDFAECDDIRGRAWVLVALGEILLDLKQEQAANIALLAGMHLKADIGECSKEYRDLLMRVLNKRPSDDCAKRVAQEFSRVEAIVAPYVSQDNVQTPKSSDVGEFK